MFLRAPYIVRLRPEHLLTYNKMIFKDHYTIYTYYIYTMKKRNENANYLTQKQELGCVKKSVASSVFRNLPPQ